MRMPLEPAARAMRSGRALLLSAGLAVSGACLAQQPVTQPDTQTVTHPAEEPEAQAAPAPAPAPAPPAAPPAAPAAMAPRPSSPATQAGASQPLPTACLDAPAGGDPLITAFAERLRETITGSGALSLAATGEACDLQLHVPGNLLRFETAGGVMVSTVVIVTSPAGRYLSTNISACRADDLQPCAARAVAAAKLALVLSPAPGP